MSRNASVHLVTTGGTIANPPDREGYLPGADLVEAIPELDDIASITATDVASIASHEIAPEIWYRLHGAITELAEREDPPDGIVVTHGSNTLEETAYFLHLTLQTDVPVVLTAAQRKHGTVGNDGDRNLIDAVAVAAHEEARGRGALVVVNEEIHNAREVTKTVSTRPNAWDSANLGVLGLIDSYQRIQFYRRSDRRHAPDAAVDLNGTDSDDFPRVEIIYSAAGSEGGVVRAAVADGADGLVLAALPTGIPARPVGLDGQGDAIDAAHEEGVPVVQVHRGSEGWPYPRGFIRGDVLTPQKARVLLALALLETRDPDEIQRLFFEY